MPYKEIKELRTSGRLDEAYELAVSELKVAKSKIEVAVIETQLDHITVTNQTGGKETITISQSNNDPLIWPKRNLSWVLYSQMDKYSHDLGKFLEKLSELKSLELPASEEMLYDNLSIVIGKAARSIAQQKDFFSDLFKLFDSIKELPLKRPSKWYSFLFKSFHKPMKETNRYLEFADWWNLQNLRPEDFQKEQMPNGNDVMALAEQAYISYAKHLLPKQLQNGELIFNKEKVESFLPLLNNIVENYPQFQYPIYFKAKLLLALGDKETMLSTLLPFAKKKKNDFWVWESLGDAFSDDKEKVIACYCRALSCQSPEEMLVSLRQKMASIFVEKNLFDQAKTEIDILTKSRQAKGYKIPNEVGNWMNQDWYKKALSKSSNIDYYRNYFDLADGLLFADLQKEVLVVEFINSEKKILNFIVNKTRSGFFKYDRFLKKVEIGDKFLARIEGSGINIPYKVFTLEKTDQQVSNEILKEFKGKLRKNENQLFGFVDDIFIEPRLIDKHKIIDGIEISGTAIISFNKKKNDWGWKAIRLV